MRLPPLYIDLTRREVAELQLRKLGFTQVQLLLQPNATLYAFLRDRDQPVDRDTVLLRSFRNV
jgi:hypothetical protein